jgi:ABC-type branched-subunit amino acid transport system ATPase component
VLSNVTVSVAPGEISAVLGPNGSGKSTLIKSIMGLTTIYNGHVYWDGQDITTLQAHLRARKGLGYVPQTNNVFTSLMVQENLEVGAFDLNRSQVQTELERVFDLFPSLRDRRNMRAGGLSGGERRLLAIAGALMMRSRCLLLDEPSSDLSPAMIDVVFAKIQEVRRTYQLPILIVEQNVPRVLEIAQQVYVLIRGCVQLQVGAKSTSEEQLGDLFLEAVSDREK